MASNGLDCPLCDAVLYDLDSFQRHVETHRPPHDPPHDPVNVSSTSLLCFYYCSVTVFRIMRLSDFVEVLQGPRDRPNKDRASSSATEVRDPRDMPSRYEAVEEQVSTTILARMH